ncbi:MAG: D-TA family PLP-dependent enzyme [Alphaproteobacteria bacterium]|nr:D-TA family PLP-dependent enzyme [Alphaproteobacteria bacterium]MCB9930634.1 D-TA family PLP-dependent enzyme [Alphaproteobacteria bacterium]
MTRIDAIETPAVLIDLPTVEANLSRFQTYCNAHGLKARPHIKTHKLPDFAHRQVDLGATGITCQKIGEAEVMVASGIRNVLLTYNILGASKLARLKTLAEHCTLSVVADNEVVLQGLSETFAGGPPLTVLVECDSGGGRCGVQTPGDAVKLAQWIERANGLRFGGLMTYPPKRRIEVVRDWLADAMHTFQRAGIACETVSSGGTPDIWRAHEVSAATEHRAGTYIYNDRMMVDAGAATWDDCALSVLTTVVSRPTETRAVLDGGSKAFSSDLGGLTGHGYIREYPDAVIHSLSEEHAVVDLSACTGAKPAVGERVRVVPNHACVVSNLFNQVHGIADGQVERVFTVEARGLMQ